MDLSSPSSARSPLPVRPFATPVRASPMSIPGADHAYPSAPPPLPPPANVEELGLTQDASWPFNNNPHWHGFAASGGPEPADKNSRARLGSVLNMDPREADPSRKGSTFTIVPIPHRCASPSEEGGSQAVSPSYRLQSERQLEQRSLSTSSQAYDRNLLSKIGGPNTPLRLSSVSSTASDVPSLSPSHGDGRQMFKRASMPERRRSSNDSRFSSRNDSTASAGVFTPTSFRSNSIFDAPDSSRLSGRRHPSFYFDDGSSSHRGSQDSNMYSHEESPMEEGPMKDLNLNDRSPGSADEYGARAGMKRRASSPRRDGVRLDRASITSVPSGLDPARRSIHQLPPRSSPNPRYGNPHFSSVSSASSAGNRTASLASSQGLSVASSVTSLGSGRLSPNTLSPATMDPELCSPFSTSKSLNPSPRSSVCPPPFTRHSIDGSTADLHSHASTVPNVLICDCCPKKPKKFATEEDLRLHHMEKQFTCLYCPNRFKNKNEAERHQNSLHLRRHSWSCAALPSVEHAFHASHGNSGTTDVCGYCGEEFRNPADWAARRAHLSIVHKFGECNQIKKFFRADHFRQHLKHSHAGTSGKWTNILENACMRDEPLPQPMHRPSSLGGAPAGDPGMYGHPGSGSAGGVGHSASMGSMAAPAHKPATIDEVPQEH